MAVERTLSIIKPDAVGKNVIGQIVARFEAAGLRIVASRMEHLTEEKAKGFYAEHDGKGFFADLVAFMTSGPVVVQVLEGEDAIALNRQLMGATNPQEARFEQISRPRSMQMPSMDRIRRLQPREKWLTFLLTTSSAHDRSH